jgi:hypothetical protein
MSLLYARKRALLRASLLRVPRCASKEPVKVVRGAALAAFIMSHVISQCVPSYNCECTCSIYHESCGQPVRPEVHVRMIEKCSMGPGTSGSGGRYRDPREQNTNEINSRDWGPSKIS